MRKHLLHQHLEKVSWRVLEEYRDLVRDMIRGRSGVYALYRRDRLYYVGLAGNLMRRLNAHLKDRHRGSWDRFSVYLTTQSEHMKELESLLLRIAAPPGNKVSGRFARSENLLQDFNRRISQADADKRAQLLGGQVERRRRRSKTTGSTGARALAGIVDRSVRLRARRKGWEYRASLRSDGTIRYDGRIYESPSAAAEAAVNHRVNGWAFWYFRDKGEWMQLRRLRR